MAIERTDLVGKPYTPRGKYENLIATGDVLRAVDVTEECRAHPGFFRLHHPTRHVLLLYTRTWKGIYVSIVTSDGEEPAAGEGCSGDSLQEFKQQLRWFDAHADSVMAKLRPLQMGNHEAVELLEKYAPS